MSIFKRALGPLDSTFIPPADPVEVCLWDMDGVMVEWDEDFWIEVMRLQPDLTLPPVEQRMSYNLLDSVPGLTAETVDTVLNLPGFYRRLKPIPEAVEAFKEMEAEGVKTFIASSPTTTNPDCASDKYNWVAKVYSQDVADRVILSRDKTLLRGRFLIDDKDVIKGHHTPMWEHVVADKHYNQNSPALRRLTDFSQWREIMPELLQSKSKVIHV